MPRVINSQTSQNIGLIAKLIYEKRIKMHYFTSKQSDEVKKNNTKYKIRV